MTKKEIDALIDNYFKWLKDNTSTRLINDTWSEITTPYLDRHNDCLQIYAKKENNTIVLTDDGYIINDLISSGCALDSQRRKEILNTTDEEKIKEYIWEHIKEINKTMPPYKYIREIIVTDQELIKTTTEKVKRHEEIKKVLGK